MATDEKEPINKKNSLNNEILLGRGNEISRL